MTKIDKSFGNLGKSEDQKYLETLMADMGVQDLNDLSPSERKAFINAAKPTYKMKRKAKIKKYFKLSSENKNRKGYLVPIGGSEDRTASSIILRNIVKISGGKGSKIIIVPSASILKDAGLDYLNIFKSLGADAEIRSPLDSDFSNYINDCSSIFFTGGDQNRLANLISDSEIKRSILNNYFSGMNICGSSAGASYISKNMISGGREDNLVIRGGLGAADHLIIDQHFGKRNRIKRLSKAISMYPDCIGIGIDENTSAFISPDNFIEVFGSGKVTLLNNDKKLVLDNKSKINLSSIIKKDAGDTRYKPPEDSAGSFYGKDVSSKARELEEKYRLNLIDNSWFKKNKKIILTAIGSSGFEAFVDYVIEELYGNLRIMPNMSFAIIKPEILDKKLKEYMNLHSIEYSKNNSST